MATSGENADENLAGARDGLPRACSGRLGPGAARVIAPEGRFEGVTLGSGLAPDPREGPARRCRRPHRADAQGPGRGAVAPPRPLRGAVFRQAYLTTKLTSLPGT